MGRNVTVEIDETMYRELEQLARVRGTKPEEALAGALEAYLEQRKVYVNDPFFQIGKVGRSDLGNLAAAHDKYLYGGR